MQTTDNISNTVTTPNELDEVTNQNNTPNNSTNIISKK